MDRNGFIAVFCILLFVSTNCNASLSFHRRKLIDSEQNNASTTSSKVPPTTIPVNETKTNPNNTEKSQQDKQTEPQVGNQTNSNVTLPIDSKGSSKPENDTKTVGAPSPPADVKNASTVPIGNEKANGTTPNLGNIDSCEGSIVSCTDRGMLACIHTSNASGSKGLFLVVKNEGEITLKVIVQVPNGLINDFPDFEVPKHKTNRLDISSTMGKSTELIVNSGNGKCVLPLVKSVSVENILHQLSFYSKQVTPIYAVYASFVVALLLGGTWACCRFRKRNQQDGIPYQELEMGLPESSSAVNLDEEAEGWDDNWDDDWDEDSTVKSPSGQQLRSVSSNGLVSRSSKKDGWENNWDD
ncbi:hypothetical protein ACS0TY_015319 [Phlomoides rotata]